MIDIPPVSRILTELSIPHRVFHHHEQVGSLQQAADERGQTINQVVRSILFRLGEGNFVMCLVAGPAQISWPALRSHLNQSRLTMASEAEVLEVTGYRVGAVSPFGLRMPIRILADHNVFISTEISIGSGERGTAVILNSADLRSNIDNIEIGYFAQNL